MATQLVAITGNTYPVKESLKALGARWNPDQKVWMVVAEKADRARQIVSGSGLAAPTAPGMASEKQRIALSKLLRRVEHVRMFDSFSGTGAQLADKIREKIQQCGGMQKLTSRQASQFIDSLIGAVEDEM